MNSGFTSAKQHMQSHASRDTQIRDFCQKHFKGVVVVKWGPRKKFFSMLFKKHDFWTKVFSSFTHILFQPVWIKNDFVLYNYVLYYTKSFLIQRGWNKIYFRYLKRAEVGLYFRVRGWTYFLTFIGQGSKIRSSHWSKADLTRTQH